MFVRASLSLLSWGFSLRHHNETEVSGMDRLKGLEPEKVFDYFDIICDIPHGSNDTAALLAFLVSFAEERGLEYKTDEAGNIVIYKNASPGYEGAAPVILQGHMDMVCAKTADSTHDFSKDPLDLSLEGDDLYAEGTSLGGDDGIAVAYILAILDDDSLAHPPIEALITNNEEIGLLGAIALDPSVLRGRRMINIDSESEGIFTCGCAGGACVDFIRPVKRVRMKGLPVVVSVSGLLGGHSGEKIIKGRPNAVKLLARLLHEIDDEAAFCLESIYGGDKDNAIPVSASAHIVIDEDDFHAVARAAERFEKDVRREYRGIDEGIHVGIEKGNVHKLNVLDAESQDSILFFLFHAPHGVRKMNGLIEGLVETSSNLGVVRTGENEFACTVNIRSSVATARKAMVREIYSLGARSGGNCRTNGEYPEWEYRSRSELRDVMKDLYVELYGKEPVINVIHAGLECGIFAQKIRGFDGVSIGPDIRDIHTAGEKLSISSARRVYEYLTALLARLK